MAVSYSHEVLIELFRSRASLGPEMLSQYVGIEVPKDVDIRISEGDLGDIEPVERRADLVLIFYRDEVPVFGLIIEVQLAQVEAKRHRWPRYGVTLGDRLKGSPVVVLVVTPDWAVAQWASQPIPLGGRSAYQVEVVGPDGRIPAVTDAHQPPELLTLSAILHGASSNGEAVVQAALACYVGLPTEEGTKFYEMLWACLGPDMRESMSVMLAEKFSYPQSDFAKEHFGKGRSEGLVEGQAKLLLRLLKRRFGEVPTKVETRIREADIETQLRWGDRVLDAPSLEAVFANDD